MYFGGRAWHRTCQPKVQHIQYNLGVIADWDLAQHSSRRISHDESLFFTHSPPSLSLSLSLSRGLVDSLDMQMIGILHNLWEVAVEQVLSHPPCFEAANSNYMHPTMFLTHTSPHHGCALLCMFLWTAKKAGSLEEGK